eukprot:CAMPEP_0172653350 /NCGR_PEP_ID=MMETSP1068-20121228/243780_1 /TAXON_ID=35684 /ORGANISM="Pseudopedinella elastica, Strain CCMP716" /LENGTH=539 /DNA_ID=CAMNT_0013467781 /DNA_START=43 /DNA_END=1662 /DNA_ORIENTATION=-
MGNTCDLRLASAHDSRAVVEINQMLPWKCRDNRHSKIPPKPHAPRYPPRDGTPNTLLVVSQAFLPIMEYFEPIYRHYLLTLPLCRAYRSQTALTPEVWIGALYAAPLEVPLDRATLLSLGGSDGGTAGYSSGDQGGPGGGTVGKVLVGSQKCGGLASNRVHPVGSRKGKAPSAAKAGEVELTLASAAGSAAGSAAKSPSGNSRVGGPSDGLRSTRGKVVVDRGRARRLHLSLARGIFTLRFAKDAGLEALAEVLEAGLCCPNVLAKAMDALNSALEDEATRAEAQRKKVPWLLFAAMRRWPEDEALLSRALYTSMLLLRPKGGSEGCLFKGDEMCSVFVASVVQEGVPLVLATMKRHRGSRRLQYMGCWAMVNMALESAHKQALLAGGAIQSVCEAMDEHTADPKVQFRALFALINLVTVGGVSQTESPAAAEALTRRVVRATSAFLGQVDVAGRGCMVLYNLSLDAANHGFLRRLQVAPLLHQAAAAHPADPMLQFVATSTAARLADPLDTAHHLNGAGQPTAHGTQVEANNVAPNAA